jgi:hypothetical protein
MSVNTRINRPQAGGFVPGSHGNAQSCGAFGHGGIADCWNEKSFALQRARKMKCRFLVADDPRKNCAASATLVFGESGTRQKFLHQSNSFPKQKSSLLAFW